MDLPVELHVELPVLPVEVWQMIFLKVADEAPTLESAFKSILNIALVNSTSYALVKNKLDELHDIGNLFGKVKSRFEPTGCGCGMSRIDRSWEEYMENYFLNLKLELKKQLNYSDLEIKVII